MKAWGITDTGVVRKENQDAFSVEELGGKQLLCVVCDGMGGARSGNVASRLAIDVFIESMRLSVKEEMSREEMLDALRESVNSANRAVYEQSSLGVEYAGMGTTLVCAYIAGGQALFANIGDSRAYRINKEGILRISKDHSLVEDLIDKGELTPQEAKNHPSRHLITRALGTDISVDCDIYQLQPVKGEYILLCSDGLSNIVSDQELLFELMHNEDPNTSCNRLMNIAKSRGAPDNVTIVVIQI